MNAMRKTVRFSIFSLALLLMISMVFSPMIAYATEAASERKHYMGSVVNAGHDTGFSENNKITEKNPPSTGSSDGTLVAFMWMDIRVLPKTKMATLFF